ncbi:MAG: SpoIIE family protein phosphatase [Bacteroidales bacterium]|nr:SpoIIE family protein phosphatase [Bacteroidales bacterium]
MSGSDNRKSFARREISKILVAIAVFMAASLSYYMYVRHWTLTISEKRAENTLAQTERLILTRLGRIEVIIKSMQLLAENSLNEPDEMFGIAQHIVESSPSIIGADMAFIEYYYPQKGRLYEPWVGYEPGRTTLSRKQIGSDDHDYTGMDWFTKGLAAEDGSWSNPYLEYDVTKTTMMTYARAIRDKSGHRIGVISADITLDTLTSIVRNVNLYPNSFCVLTSKNGDTIVPAPHKVTGKCHIYSKDIAGRNLILTMTIPDRDLYHRLRTSSLVFASLVFLDLLAIIFIARSSLKSLWTLNEVRIKEQHIEDELAIARNIQQSLLPTETLTKEARTLDIKGLQVPAKYVGGDLYDYYVRDNKLFFCIGDVSGKGVPAALLMSIAHSLFRTLSAQSDRPEIIMRALNNSISDNNPDIMFITMFLGTMDLTTGEVCYCNAGHNPPIIIRPGHAEFLDTEPNLLLGVDLSAEYTSQTLKLAVGDTLFLYTDGLTEAENLQKQTLGEKRALEEASTFNGMTAEEQIRKMHDVVLQFADKAEQSDDLTMLAIQFIKSGYTLVMGNDIQELNKLEPFLNDFFAQENLDPSLLPQLNLALEEAATNVIMYAYPEGEKGTADLTLDIKDGHIIATLSDAGVPFDPLQLPDTNLNVSLEERKIGGLGIHLIKEIMSEIEYEYKDGKNVLNMTYDVGCET